MENTLKPLKPKSKPKGKPQPTTAAGAFNEQKREKAEEATAAATMQTDVAARGELGGLGIGERGRVQTWLKANPGKTVADAKKALGMNAKAQGKALEQ